MGVLSAVKNVGNDATEWASVSGQAKALKQVNAARWWIRYKHFLGTLACLVCIAVGFAIGRWATTSLPRMPCCPNGTCPSPSRPIFMLMGDSLTELGADPGSQGWCSRLQQTYIRRVDVVNRGLSGWNTKMFREKALPTIAQELTNNFAPTVVTLWLGANDAALTTGPSAAQHVPVSEYQNNLVYILTQFRALAPQATILLISPPIVDDETRQSIQVSDHGHGAALDRSNEAVGIYAAAAMTAAAAVSGVAFLDMYTYLNTAYPTAAKRQQILGDGLHFNAEGNRIVFEKINEQIRSLVPSTLIDKNQISS